MGDIFGIADLTGSILAYNTNQAAQQAAMNATQQAVDEINAVGAPPDLAQQITLQKYQQAGILTPQLEQTINAHFQQIQGVSSPVQQAQSQALQQMSQIASGGLNSQDRMALAQIQQQIGKQNEAAQNDIMQNLAARGQMTAGGASGAEIAGRLSAAQNAQNQLSNQGLGVAAQAQQRALQGIAGLGNLSGQQAQQQFGQNAQQAAIANEQQRFNVQNQLGVQAANTAYQNQANAANLANQQALSNLNTQAANQEAQREVAAQQQMYLDAANHAQAQANAKLGQGTQIAQFGQNTAQSQGQMIGGAGTLGQGIYNYANSPSSSNSGGTSSGTGQYTSSGGTSYGGDGGTNYNSSSNVVGGYGLNSDGGTGGGGYSLFSQGGEVGYNEGGFVPTMSKMHFHGGKDMHNHPHYTNHPPSKNHNPSMLTQPSEYNMGGEVGYNCGGMTGYAKGGTVSQDILKKLQAIKHSPPQGHELLAKQRALMQGARLPMQPNPMMTHSTQAPPQPMGQAPQSFGQQLPPAVNPGNPVQMQRGGMTPGPQIVPGSSPRNDVVEARLSSGEYVVPKEDAPSMELIHQILKGMKAKKK